MNQETLKSPFPSSMLFVSETDKGICFVTCKSIFVETKTGCREIVPLKFFQEAYVVSPEKILLVEKFNCGSLEEVFSFNLSVLNLISGEVEAEKKFNSSDYRGLKLKEDHVIVGLNNYDSQLFSTIDPEGLNYDPPCPEKAIYSEVLHLDFDLKELRSTQYDENIPDDLIMHLGGIGQKDVIIFNHALSMSLNRFVCQIGDVTYTVRDGNHFIKIDKNGFCTEIYQSKTDIVGLGMSLENSLPEFRVYEEDKVVVLTSENSVRFILS